MKNISDLEPKIVWKFFEEITKVPRPSKKEEKIIEYLINFAKKHNLEYRKDKIGNIVIKKPATEGMENIKSVVLQSHMDMVCEKNSDVQIDFDIDPIIPIIDGEWVKAKGTTLGADDGIGMAAQLAILAEKNIKHGPIECLFTVDEETGLTGAFEIEEGFFDSHILLNLDSEDEGEIFIGCAGGIKTTAYYDFERDDVPQNSETFVFNVSGLKGGHSGDEIHKGHGNSIKIANRFLFDITNQYEAGLHSFNGGNKHNAIPREAEIVFTIDENYINDLNTYFAHFRNEIINETGKVETQLKLELKKTQSAKYLIDFDTQVLLTHILYAYPNGVHAWSQAVPDLVETSSNLASIRFSDNDEDNIVIVASHRSSLESGIRDITNMVESVFLLGEADVDSSGKYPGWSPNPNSEILKIAEKTFFEMYNKKPEIKAVHAGLECGLFLEKYPGLDMISFGPTIKNAHSPDEKLEIKTVKLWYDHLLEILRNIPQK